MFKLYVRKYLRSTISLENLLFSQRKLFSQRNLTILCFLHITPQPVDGFVIFFCIEKSMSPQSSYMFGLEYISKNFLIKETSTLCEVFFPFYITWRSRDNRILTTRQKVRTTDATNDDIARIDQWHNRVVCARTLIFIFKKNFLNIWLKECFIFYIFS